MLICVTVLILKHGLFNYFHIGNVNTQNNVDEPGPQLVVEPPPQGLFPLSGNQSTLYNNHKNTLLYRYIVVLQYMCYNIPTL